jgi:hypothetical protein
MLLCSECGAPAAWLFNNDRLACDPCKEERLHDDHRIESEDDLSWPLRPPVPNGAAA